MDEKTIPPELREQICRDRQAIEAESPELEERHARVVEAKQEETFSEQLRRVIHAKAQRARSRQLTAIRPVRERSFLTART